MTRLGSVVAAAAFVFLAGCASMQSVAGVPIDGTIALAGTWTGTVTPGHWGVMDPFNLTITPDGRLTATWDSDTAWGTVTVENGRATFEMHPTIYEGTIRLYESGGTRELILQDEVRSLTARVVQQR
jgi:uncharacterized protein YndB with AHSA1/START domain